jgi:Uma2 family endonuclease
MRFIEGPPRFAAEVRSENDYGPAAEEAMGRKRCDYFQAGTLVVWDVDPIAETVTAYRSTAPDHPTVYRRGDTAEAEPAVPGWRMPVDDVFPRG